MDGREAPWNLGENLANLGRCDEAQAVYREGLECLEQSLRAGKSPVETIGTYGVTRVESQLPEYMESEIFAEHAAMQRRLGRLLADQGQREEAIQLLSESTRVLRIVLINSPGTPDYMDLAASSEQVLAELTQEESPDRALSLLRSAVKVRRGILEIAPRHVDYRARLGETLGQLGLLLAEQREWAEAQSILEEAIREDESALKAKPDHAEARDHLPQHLSHLSRLLATADADEVRDPERAITLARRGVELAPEQGQAWTALAMVQYRSGDWVEAVVAAEKALPLSDGGTAVDHFILAMSHWQLGQRTRPVAGTTGPSSG